MNKRLSLNQVQAWHESIKGAREIATGGVWTAAEFLVILGRGAKQVPIPRCVYRQRKARDDRARVAFLAQIVPPKPPEGRTWIFSNGTEYDWWTGRNCDRCALAGDPAVIGSSPCQIFEAIHDAAMGDGTVTIEIAERMGHSGRCPEFVEAH